MSDNNPKYDPTEITTVSEGKLINSEGKPVGVTYSDPPKTIGAEPNLTGNVVQLIIEELFNIAKSLVSGLFNGAIWLVKWFVKPLLNKKPKAAVSVTIKNEADASRNWVIKILVVWSVIFIIFRYTPLWHSAVKSLNLWTPVPFLMILFGLTVVSPTLGKKAALFMVGGALLIAVGLFVIFWAMGGIVFFPKH